MFPNSSPPCGAASAAPVVIVASFPVVLVLAAVRKKRSRRMRSSRRHRSLSSCPLSRSLTPSPASADNQRGKQFGSCQSDDHSNAKRTVRSSKRSSPPPTSNSDQYARPGRAVAVPGLNVVQTGGPGGQTSVFMRGTNSNHVKV